MCQELKKKKKKLAAKRKQVSVRRKKQMLNKIREDNHKNISDATF